MNVEQLLYSIGAEADWPATPPIAEAVAARLEPVPQIGGVTPRHPGDSPRVRVRRPLALALALLLIGAATAAAIPAVREPVLDWLGLRAVKIERVPRALPEAAGSNLALGEQTTLARARSRLGFVPVVPAGLGSPTVYYEGFPPGGQLALVYRGGRILLTEVEGSLERRYLFKFLRAGTGVDAIRLDGGRGLWIHGQMHQYVYADRTGAIRTDSVRTAGNVLLWRRHALLLRLEGARTKAEALRVASSLRAAP
jgi:hypothetical protein